MVLPYIAIYTTLIPLALGLWYFDKLTKPFKWILFYLALSFLSDQICLTYFIRHLNNMVVVNVFILLEKIILFSLIANWPKHIQEKWKLISGLLLIIIFWIYSALLTHTKKDNLGIFEQMPVFNTVVSSVIAIFAAVKLFIIVEEASIISKNPVFWGVTSIFVYASITLIVVSTVFLMPKQAWLFYNISHIIFCLLLTKTYIVAGNTFKVR